MDYLKWFIIGMLVVLPACSNEQESSYSEPAPSKKQEPQASAPPSPTPPAEAAFFPTLNICEAIPSDLVATTIGGTVKNPEHANDYGALGKTCTYGIKPAGGSFEHVAIGLAPANLYQTSESILDTDKGLGQQATAESLQGLGDEAFVIHNQTEKQSTVHVLKNNAFSLSVTAANLDHARKLTELALQRIQP